MDRIRSSMDWICYRLLWVETYIHVGHPVGKPRTPHTHAHPHTHGHPLLGGGVNKQSAANYMNNGQARKCGENTSQKEFVLEGVLRFSNNMKGIESRCLGYGQGCSLVDSGSDLEPDKNRLLRLQLQLRRSNLVRKLLKNLNFSSLNWKYVFTYQVEVKLLEKDDRWK